MLPPVAEESSRRRHSPASLQKFGRERTKVLSTLAAHREPCRLNPEVSKDVLSKNAPFLDFMHTDARWRRLKDRECECTGSGRHFPEGSRRFLVCIIVSVVVLDARIHGRGGVLEHWLKG